MKRREPAPAKKKKPAKPARAKRKAAAKPKAGKGRGADRAKKASARVAPAAWSMSRRYSRSRKTGVSIKRTEGPDPGVEAIRAKDPVTIVIFGASGDLAKRKLLPALYHLQAGAYLPDQYAVVGFSRTPMTDEAYREGMLAALREQVKGDTIGADHPIVQALHYQAGDADNPATFHDLKTRLEAIEKERGLPGNRLFYLSVAPEFFPLILENLSAAGLSATHRRRWSRVIIEPFGTDLQRRALNAIVGATLDGARSTASTTTSGKRPSRTS